MCQPVNLFGGGQEVLWWFIDVVLSIYV